jgi:hypothetical protein
MLPNEPHLPEMGGKNESAEEIGNAEMRIRVEGYM